MLTSISQMDTTFTTKTLTLGVRVARLRSRKWLQLPICPPFKGVLYQNIDIFKESAPRSRTYQLRGQGKKNVPNHDKQTPHTVLPKLSPKMYNAPLRIKSSNLHPFISEMCELVFQQRFSKFRSH